MPKKLSPPKRRVVALYLRIKGFRPFRFTDYNLASVAVTDISSDISAVNFYVKYGQPTITNARGVVIGYVTRTGQIYYGTPTEPNTATLIFTPNCKN